MPLPTLGGTAGENTGFGEWVIYAAVHNLEITSALFKV